MRLLFRVIEDRSFAELEMVLDGGRVGDRAPDDRVLLDDRVFEEERVLDSELDRFRLHPSASSSCRSSSIVNLFRIGAWSRQFSSRATPELNVSIFSQLFVRLCR